MYNKYGRCETKRVGDYEFVIEYNDDRDRDDAINGIPVKDFEKIYNNIS